MELTPCGAAVASAVKTGSVGTIVVGMGSAGVAARSAAEGAAGTSITVTGAPVIGRNEDIGAGAVGTSTVDVVRAHVAKRLVMPSTKSDQDGSPWSFSRRKYHWWAAPSRKNTAVQTCMDARMPWDWKICSHLWSQP